MQKDLHWVSKAIGGAQPGIFGTAARHEDLVENIDLPVHSVPADLFDCLFAGYCLKIGDQLTKDRFATGRWGKLYSANDREIKRRVALLCADRRADMDPLAADVEGDPPNSIIFAAQLDHMRARIFGRGRFVFDRMSPVAGQSGNHGAQVKMGAKLLRETIKFMDVTFFVDDLDTALRLSEQGGWLAQDVEPSDAFLPLDGNSGRVDCALS